MVHFLPAEEPKALRGTSHGLDIKKRGSLLSALGGMSYGQEAPIGLHGLERKPKTKLDQPKTSVCSYDLHLLQVSWGQPRSQPLRRPPADAP